MNRITIPLALLVAVGWSCTCGAGVILFDEPTDTIRVAGDTIGGNVWTFEAQILFTTSHAGQGIVYNEWMYGWEDKILWAGPNAFGGGAYREPGHSVTTTLTLGQWHHIALVLGPTSSGLYLDGQRVASRNYRWGVSEGWADRLHIGAIYRDWHVSPSFIGYLDSVRISDVARYSGESFTPPIGDLASDANTLLLYNFNEPAGSTTVIDGSGREQTGYLGEGFTGATSPEFVSDPIIPEPSEVDIDIKPGSDPNSINLGSKGRLPVAILSNEDFDALWVDEDTVLLADPELVELGAVPVPPIRSTVEDVDEDGLDDLLLFVSISELAAGQVAALDPESEGAVLVGETFDGIPIIGADFVRIVPSKGRGKSGK